MTGRGPDLLERLLPAGTDPLGPDRRSQAQAWLELHGLPTAADESWKYTALDAILGSSFEPVSGLPASLPGIADVDALAGDHGGPRLVFVDGIFVPSLSRLADLPPGVVCGNRPLTGAVDEAADGWRAAARFDGFQALNHAAARDRAVVAVPAGTCIGEPIHVVHLTVGGPTPVAAQPHTTIDVGADAQVTLIETYAGPPGPHLTNATTSIDVGPGALVVHRKVLTGPVGSVHVAHTAIHQDHSSTVRSWSFLAGAEIARNAIDVVLDGPEARIDLQGLQLPVGTQRLDTAVTVEHASSHGVSRQLYKSVVDDHGRGSFSGRVIVRGHTSGNDADQTSRSLLLRPTAQTDARPWLEIFADDVRCTHGAAIGRLDEDALFFLRVRGIPRDEARAMLVSAFIGELADLITVPTLRTFVDDAVAAIRTSAGEVA